MYIYGSKTQDSQSDSATDLAQQRSQQEPAPAFVDNRPVAVAQRALQARINSSVRVQQQQAYQTQIDDSFAKAQARPGTMPGAPIQLVRYSSVSANPYQGTLDVTPDERNITITGRAVKTADQSEVNITGSVLTEEYSFPPNREGLPTKSDVNGTPPDALRVHNLVANPQGIGLGQLLTYHHGLLAQGRNLQHVIAMNVTTGARGPFYERMGFGDYNPNPEESYRNLSNTKNSLDTWLRKPEVLDPSNQLYINPENYGQAIAEKVRLAEKMAESPMIIDADTLVTNSQVRWSAFWREGDPPRQQAQATTPPSSSASGSLLEKDSE